MSAHRRWEADPHLASGRLAGMAFPGWRVAGWQAGDGMMKAIRISDYNAAPSLEEIAKPVAGAGDVLVRVKAASLNPLDVKLQRGYMAQFFPLQDRKSVV